MSDPLDGFSSQSNAPQPLSLVEAIALREQIACLECEKATLQAELDRCRSETEPLKTSDRTQQALLQAEQERATELAKANEAMRRAVSRLAVEPNLDSFLGFLLYEIATQLNTDTAVITPYDPSTDQMWIAALFSNGKLTPLDPMTPALPRPNVPFLDRLLNAEGFCVFDVEEDADLFWTGAVEFLRTCGKRKSIAFAICLDDRFFGQISLAYETLPHFNLEQTALVQALSTQAALAIQLTRLAEEAKQAAIAREQQLAAQERAAILTRVNFVLQRSAERLGAATDPEAIIVEILRTAAEVLAPLGVKGMGLIIYRPVTRTVRVKVHIVDDVEQTIAGSDLDRDWSVDLPSMIVPWRRIQSENFVWGLTSDASVLIPEVRQYHESRGTRAIAYIPLKRGEEIVGWIGFDLASETPPTARQIEIIQALTSQVALALEMERLAEEVKQAAIAREQEKAAQERAAELAKANEALRRSVERMASDTRLETLVSAFLSEAIATVGAHSAAVMLRLPGSLTFTPAAIVEESRLLSPEELANDPYLSRYVEFSSSDIDGIFSMLARGETPSIRVEDLREVFPEAYTYHQQRGHHIIWHAPLRLKGEIIGFTAIALRDDRLPSRAVRETVTALAQQLTLALELTRLAEEAKQAAIAREQEKAAQERAVKLAEINVALRQTIDVLANERDLDRFLGHVLKIIAEQFDAPLTEYWFHPEPENLAYIGLTYWQGQILQPEDEPDHPGLIGFPVASDQIHNEDLHQRKQHFVVEDIATDPFVILMSSQIGVDIGEWYLTRRGKLKGLNIPLVLSDRTIGAVSVYLPCDRYFTDQKIDLAHALAQQVTLAIQLTHLAEEAKQAAIAREQEKAAQARATELARANDALRRGVERLVASGTLDAALDAFLLEALSVAEAASGAVMERGIGHEFIMRALAQDGELVKPFDPHSTEDLYRERTANDISSVMRRTAAGEIVVFPVDDNLEAWFPEAAAYHRSRGHQMIWHFPFQVGGAVVGYLGLAFRESRSPSEVLRETVQALAHQASLALETQRLAEQAKQAAIAREQEKAAQERAAKLEKVNVTLRRSLDWLAHEGNLNQFLERVLLEIAYTTQAELAYLFVLQEPERMLELTARVIDGEISNHPTPTEPAIFFAPFSADITPAFRFMEEQDLFLTLDMAMLQPELTAMMWPDAIDWHLREGREQVASLVLKAGDRSVGFLGLGFRESREFSQEERELVISLSNQASLAILLIQLAEEAKQAALAKLNEVIAREQEQAAQQRATELAVVNEELKQRDRLLSVVAQITKDLLEVEEIDIAIPAALQAVGEVAEISRVLLVIEAQDPDTQMLHHHIVYEWAAEGIQRALGLIATDNATFHSLIEALHQGQSWWGRVADLPDVTRLEFEALGILSTGVVPIFFEGRYIGCVALDDCVNVRQWNQQEIDVLQAAAESIGAALYRNQLVDRLIEEQIQAEQARAAELMRANVALQNCVDRLAGQLNPKSFIDHVLLESAAQVEAHAAALFLYNDDETQSMQSFVKEGQVQSIATHPDLTLFRNPVSRDPVPLWDYALAQSEAVFFNLNNERVCSRFQWHQSQGHQSIVRVPLLLGSQLLGFIGFCFQAARSRLPSNIELVMTLAQQVAVALHLAQLAEQNRHAILTEERNRLAGEIHDTLAQAFNGISIQLGVAKRIQDPEEVQKILDRASNLAQTGLAEARRSVWALYDGGTHYIDLARALTTSVEQLTDGSTARTVLNLQEATCNLPAIVTTNLLRIGQEALHNALKHAQATTIWIDLDCDAKAVSLSVRDNGRGFTLPASASRVSDGFGLMGMHQRAERIGAQLTIATQPGQGTEVIVYAPLSVSRGNDDL